MNAMLRVKAANKRRRENYSKLKTHEESVITARNMLAAREEVNVRKARSREKKRKVDEQNVNASNALPNDEKIKIGVAFENQCSLIEHGFCQCCRRIGLSLEISLRGVCSDCTKYDSHNYFEENKMLPIWYLNGYPQFHVPTELSSLTLAEKMLIQLASPFIPLRHIKNGVFGLSGHVCCFEQDVEGFVNSLPRRKSDIDLLDVLKTVRAEIGSSEDRVDVYKVRKANVGNALCWLKEYNIEYKDVEIDMSALDWLCGEEGSLETVDFGNDITDDNEVTEGDEDLGPSASYTRESMKSGNNIKTFGYVSDAPADIVSPNDTIVNNEILNAIDKCSEKRSINVQWPSTGSVAISEFSSTRIFVRAFPWLFPGGLGDPKDFKGDLNKWGEYLLYYEDGRFSKDKFFSFYALNYITRHRNSSSANWFMKDFNRNGPSNLEELKKSIANGDTQFVNRLTYFNKRVKGSTSFWYQKRAEVYSWLNHHVEQKNGPPSFFITLSCSEYYWKDIIRLLRERMTLAGDNFEECYLGSPQLSRILNDYAIVVQEYFQKRVDIWINSVGRTIFGIAHWWGRFEFTPGRGQIHIHFIAIRKDQSILRLCYQDLKNKDKGKQMRDNRLAEWASTHFGLTATVDDGFDQLNIEPKESPCSTLLSDYVTSPQLMHDDQQRLMKYCQVHECNSFCLRKRGSGKCGAGKEVTAGARDTPGFKIRDVATVVNEHQRCLKLQMPRNHPRVNQTSTDLIQTWRGNCDIQIMIYESDPDNFDMREISKVTDYVVAYSCKGNATLREEIENNRRLILGMEETTYDAAELKRVCKHVMNKAASSRLISKAEASVLLGNLSLTTCSEYIESVSLVKSTNITSNDQKVRTSNLIEQYQNRPIYQNDLSLHEFYKCYRDSKKGKKPAIPHYIGVSGDPCFPVSEAYARHVLIVYKPWRDYPNQTSWKSDFDIFINSKACPDSAQLTYNRVLQRYYDGLQFADPKCINVDHSKNFVEDDDKTLLCLVGLKGNTDGCGIGEMDGLEKGLDFDWNKSPPNRDGVDYSILPGDWLATKVTEFKNNLDTQLLIPRNSLGNAYDIHSLYPDQKFILASVFSKVRQWLECNTFEQFVPLRCTILGQAGSGKSVLLNTITSTMRSLFGYNNVLKVGCPTGTSAFNAFGETLHQLTCQGIGSEYTPNSMTDTKRQLLTSRYKHLLCLIIDERSLLTSRLLGTTAQVISETIFHGCNSEQLWGGLPILILAGDDYQLPGIHEGAFEVHSRSTASKMTQLGRRTFVECASTAFQLRTIRRVSDKKQDDKDLLSRIRLGDSIHDADVDKIQALHLDNIRNLHGPSMVAEIESDSIYLFYTNEKRIQHNIQKLLTLNSVKNPTAIIRTKGSGKRFGKSVNRHFQGETPKTSLLCVGAAVSIQGYNFCPLWGLHNGACGTIKEIIFKPGESPISGHQPIYVVVYFPMYIGPSWDSTNPKEIPIPPVTVSCAFNCCTRIFIPLELSFARTIHKFQGLQAGPVDAGKLPNMFNRIVCDPDVKGAEGRATGLFYTAISRATTLGDRNGLHSAIYFTGPNLTRDRIKNLTMKADTSRQFENVKRRRAWVDILETNTVSPDTLSDHLVEDTFQWIMNTTVSYDTLYNRTQQYTKFLSQR